MTPSSQPSRREPSDEAPGRGERPLPLPPLRSARRRAVPTRRTAHSVEAIVAAAINVLDEAGVGGLSMRRVAERLGTGPASLYAHVSGRDELLELVFDELVAEVELPAPDPHRWREQLHQMLGDLRVVLTAHRDVALAGLGRIPTTPRVLGATEVLVGVMAAGGLGERTIALGLDQLILYVSASAFEDGLLAQSGMSQEDVLRYYADIHTFYAALPGEMFPALTRVAPHMFGADDDERFRFGLDVLIAGLEAVDKLSG